ncbi:hypothetical protein LY76DRAFT_192349 [Colletotrichum caudatum]|nr:hypothetical protein LY76DRAFT_192349 [Colletotrichum caudatum]
MTACTGMRHMASPSHLVSQRPWFLARAEHEEKSKSARIATTTTVTTVTIVTIVFIVSIIIIIIVTWRNAAIGKLNRSIPSH